MAEKQTKAAPAKEVKGIKPTAEQADKARAARDEAAGKDRFIFVGDPTKKVAPQAQVIINVIKAADMDGDKLRDAAKRKGLSRAELVENLKGVLVTKQPEGRILSYYQKLLVEVGSVKLEKLNVPTPAVAEPVPAAA
jgi:hypothetical protein